MRQKNQTAPVLAGLDIGTTKVAFVIGAATADGTIDIVGVGTAPNSGMRQGVVVNIEATTEAIKKARDEAELMSGYKAVDVWLGISGTHVQSFDSRGMVAIKNKEVASHDIERVLEAAKAVAVPADRSVLHVIPREYKIDNQDGISDPIGMSGVRLEASVHIITGGQTAILNAVKCTEKAGLKVAGLVLDQLASATAVLSEDEKGLGVAVVDMGGGICGSIYFVGGSVAYTSIIPVGGYHFSHDVAVGLRTPQNCAEDLKKKFGCALVSLVNEQETIEVQGVGGRKARSVLRRDLAEVLEPRAEETLQFIQKDMQSSNLIDLLGSGVVLTGGASSLDGLAEMGEFIFDIPVRRGVAQNLGGLTDVVKSPAYATAVGLVQYGLQQNKQLIEVAAQELAKSNEKTTEGVGQRLRQWIDNLF